MTNHALDVGMRVIDETKDDPDTMIVVAISTESCDDADAAFVKWDFNQNPVTVADLNEDLGYAPDQPFATVAFTDSLSRGLPDWETYPEQALSDAITDANIKTYKYPVERLTPVVDSLEV